MCAYRTVDPDNPDGACWTCSGRRQLALYEAKDRRDADERNQRWREWSGSPEAMVARQRRHRLLALTKPAQFPDADSDPLELGKEALDRLHRVRQALGAKVAGRAYLDEATELVKQLAPRPAVGRHWPCETCSGLRPHDLRRSRPPRDAPTMARVWEAAVYLPPPPLRLAPSLERLIRRGGTPDGAAA
jgi:hypothetical protein